MQADDLQFVLPFRLTDCVQSHFKQDQGFARVFDRLLVARNLRDKLLGEIKNGFCAIPFALICSFPDEGIVVKATWVFVMSFRIKRGRGIRKVRLPHPQLR